MWRGMRQHGLSTPVSAFTRTANLIQSHLQQQGVCEFVTCEMTLREYI